MAYTSSALHPRDLPHTKTFTKTSSGPSWLTRVYAIFMDARMRQAEREIARYLNATGGKLTDEAEREIERRFLSNQSRW
jgi:hypothetical protein